MTTSYLPRNGFLPKNFWLGLVFAASLWGLLAVGTALA